MPERAAMRFVCSLVLFIALFAIANCTNGQTPTLLAPPGTPPGAGTPPQVPASTQTVPATTAGTPAVAPTAAEAAAPSPTATPKSDPSPLLSKFLTEPLPTPKAAERAGSVADDAKGAGGVVL